MKDKPRYFVKIKGCYYWRPTPRMKRVGFQDRALGKNELHAKQEAIRLSAEWDRHRFGESLQPNIMIYPPGSLGHAYKRRQRANRGVRKFHRDCRDHGGRGRKLCAQPCGRAPARKATGQINAGAAVWANTTTGEIANASGAGLFPLGAAVEAAGQDDTEVLVRLNGTTVAAVAGG